MKISPYDQKGGEPFLHWKVVQKFSTRPLKRCNTTQIENPLAEPFKISGGFHKYTKEVNYDRFGHQIKTSSHEQVHGPGVEFDFNRMSVKIEWNVSAFDPNNIATYVDTVNDSTLWSLPKRCVKLSNVSFERKLWGVCNYYFTQSFEFDTDVKTFDRHVMDEGYKCLNGKWATDLADPALTAYRGGVALPPGSLWALLPINGNPPDRDNPQHFTRYKDRNGEMGRVILDGNGEPASLGEPPLYWTKSSSYVLGDVVIVATVSGTNYSGVAGNVYQCTVGGRSSSSGSGPTGTGSAITDGTCTWKFLRSINSSGSGPGDIFVTYYRESNMLSLGIPSSLVL